MFPRLLLSLALSLASLWGVPEIREFSAAGQGTLLDDDRDFPDWLELYNAGDETYSLTEHYLTDDPAILTKWLFPRGQGVLAGSSKVIFASGKDRVNIFAGTIHTNFTLASSKGYLALVAPDGVTILDEWQDFPKQRPGVSYGRGVDGSVGYFAQPTPEAPNGQAFMETVKDTKFSVNRGFYEDPISLSLTTDTEGAAIYYTLDGSVPDLDAGTRFVEPISVEATTTVRAVAVKEGALSTNVDTHSYLFVESVLTQPESPDGFPDRWGPVSADYAFDRSVGSDEDFKGALLGYPTVSLVMPLDSWFDRSTQGGEGGIYANSLAKGADWEKAVSAEFLNFEGSPHAQVDCGIRVYGNASRQTSRPKHNMRLAFRARYGESKLDFPVFGKGKATGINGLLFNGQNGDSWFHPASGQRDAASYIRDHFAHELLGDMGHVTPPQSRAHVYVNGLYWGFYQTIERVDQHFMARLFGGEPEEYDSMKASLGEGPTLVAGDQRAYDEMFEIANEGVEDEAGYAAIQEYLNLDSFIDYMLINFWTGNRDWDGNNWRSGRHRSKGSPWHYVMWDSENIFKDANIDRTGNNTADNPTRLHRQLSRNPNYRLKFADHVRKHLFNDGLLTEESVTERWRRWAAFVRSGLLAESARWSDHHRQGRPYTVDEDYRDGLQRLVNTIIPTRARVALRQFENRELYPTTILPADFSQHGGSISPGFTLEMTAGNLFNPQDGEIFYTLDGTDPMDGGMQYEQPIVLQESVAVRARAFTESGDWSPLTEALFLQGSSPLPGELVLSEIHYHPQAATAAEDPEGLWSKKDFEFVEMQNVSDHALQLQGVALTEGVRFVFPVSELAPGEHVVIVANPTAFAARYGLSGQMAFAGQLANGGEQITLTDAEGEVLQTLFFDDEAPWPEAADGSGASLTFVVGEDRWISSAANGGTPGAGESSLGELKISLVASGTDYLVTVTLSALSEEAGVGLESSTNLTQWSPVNEGAVETVGIQRQWLVSPDRSVTRYYRARATPIQ